MTTTKPLSLSALNQAFRELLETIDPQDLGWSPSKGVWSVALILEHLCVVESSYFPVFMAVKQGNYRGTLLGRWSWLSHKVGAYLFQTMDASRRTKIKVPTVWQPRSSSQSAQTVLREFWEHTERLESELKGFTPEMLSRVIASPASSLLNYRMDMAIQIILAHRLRHLQQMKDLLVLKSN